jgi:predicted nucleic-acid-binding protein
LDINVVLDVLAAREPFAGDASSVLGRVEVGAAVGLIAAHTVTTLHFLLAKHLGRARARRVLTDLLHVVQVVAVDEDVIRQAIALDWPDFEDAVQAVCADRAGATYLVTRDKRGFRKSAVKAVTPAELLAVL